MYRTFQTIARWLLPWLSVLAISAALASQITFALAHPTPELTPAVTSSSATPGQDCDELSGRLLLEATANGWAPASAANYCPSSEPILASG